ncbi:hypothetical protein GT037_001851 [Alternaria burnsii]|uniref:Uncharacterized protein n=1 Tax=Alternaria burnsii TaxID=1187904 RepID=A0A8H7BDQ3_9PLEO|nr:uncharacterized protein GT037_001851 [Alternaria burnsii]KAF7680200.1 hypothetical protein GT037_001851 [Alternaria burnsii]
MRFTCLLLTSLVAFGFHANSLPVEPKRHAAAASEAKSDPGFKPVISWEHTNDDDDDGM